MKFKNSVGLIVIASGLAASGLEAEICRAVNDAITEQKACGGNYVGAKLEGRYNSQQAKLLCDSYDGKVKWRL